jgi:hypothetical protein
MEPRTDYLSASRVKTFKQCPMKFYLQYVAEERAEMPESWGAVNGTLLHEVFEEYATGKRRDWRNNLIEKFRATMEDPNAMGSAFKFTKGVKQTTEAEIGSKKRSCGACPFATMMADGATVFCKAMGKTTHEFRGTPRPLLEDTMRLAESVFDDDFNPLDELKTLAVEHEFDITFPNGVRTYGFIDLISEIDAESIEIRDYKSAKRTPSDKDIEKDALRYDIQLQMYYVVARYLCDNNIAPFKDTYKNIFVTIHFLRSGPITIAYGQGDYKRILDYIHNDKKAILALEKPLPLGMVGFDKNWICTYCNVGACQKACMEIHGKTREALADEYNKSKS